MRGRIVAWGNRHFGYIESDGERYFFHQNDLIERSRTPRYDDPVEFEPGPVDADGRLSARKVHYVMPCEQHAPVMIKAITNPFHPQDPINDPHKFAGRTEQFLAGLRHLKDRKNLLIVGRKGIGKTSLGLQILTASGGDRVLVDRVAPNAVPYQFKHLTASHLCQQTDTLTSVINGLRDDLMNSLSASPGFDDVLKTIATNQTWRKFAPSDDPAEPARQFAHFLESVLRLCATPGRAEPRLGATLVLDEVDVLQGQVPIAPFVRTCREMLNKARIGVSASFVLIGKPGTMMSLLQQHGSADRMFEEIQLGRMRDTELEELLRMTLANTGVGITERALKAIIALSDRCPHPVQLLGSGAFDYDADQMIDLDDVAESLRHAVEARQGDFSAILETIDHGETGSVLEALGQSRLGIIKKSHLKNCLNTFDDRLDTHLKELERQAIVEIADPWNIFLVNPLFHVYLRRRHDRRSTEKDFYAKLIEMIVTS